MTLPEFFGALRELPQGTFMFTTPELIREASVLRICPIEVLFKVRFNALAVDYRHAADAMGLCVGDMLLIIAAADHPNAPLRTELEQACGLVEPVEPELVGA